MTRRRSYLTAIAGISGAALAGCVSVDDPNGENASEGLDELSGDDSGDERAVTVDIDELLRWLPTDTSRPRFQSYELLADDEEIAADERPSIDDEPVLATLEFTGTTGIDTVDDDSPPAIHFLETTPETDDEGTTYETESYAAVIEAALDEQLLVDTYEGVTDRLVDVDEDVEIAYEGVDLDYELLGTVDPDAEYATATVSSTDGEAGELAVVFESSPTDSDIDAVREDEPTVDGIAGTGERLVVFEYAVPES